ncbi:MAG: methyltransferase [Syntrophorhabdales bacterium]|jgi:tRNA1Val (adenine37-N6)-methyltransferase
MRESIRPDETLDVLCNEKVRLIQKKGGYRLSIDALLLANFIVLKRRETLLDIGAGCGIIPIYISRRGCENRLVGIEIQDELYELSLRNKELNRCANVEFVKGDVRTAGKELGNFHVIVSNPPYTKERTGRMSPGQSRLIARYESALNLSALLSVATSLLMTHGRLYVIYPAKRLAELMYTSRPLSLEPKRLRLVHSRSGEPAVLCLVECMKGGGVNLKVEPPLYIYKDDDYTQEVKAYFCEGA